MEMLVCKYDGCTNFVTQKYGKACNQCRWLKAGFDMGMAENLVPATGDVNHYPKIDFPKYKDQIIEEKLWSHQNDWDGFGTYNRFHEQETVGETYLHKLAKGKRT